MNIFAVDNDPRIAAQSLCNKHICKMIIESAQLLCTALHVRGLDKSLLPYRPTHANHPSTIWTVASEHNIEWLWQHAAELGVEYTRRYHKIHKTDHVLHSIKPLLPKGDWRQYTPFAQAMPEQWKNDDAVTAYRCYYIAEKSRFAKWAPRATPPAWWPFKEET